MDHTKIYRPKAKKEWRILRTEDTGYNTYYAFPALLRVEDKVRVVVKSGEKHWGDTKASLTQATINPKTQQLMEVTTLYNQQGFTPQMGEIVHMPNGDVCIYIDMQKNETSERTGLWELRSFDGGETYPVSRRVGVINGIEYGYAMDMARKGDQVWMLVMTFHYQTGGRHREVHAITSKDNGESWQFCANLTEKFGFPFNECALLSTEEGFLIFTRGEGDKDRINSTSDFDSGQHLVAVDHHFNVLNKRDYRHTTNFFTLTGRPRLYYIKGNLCLFTRQWNEDTSNNPMMSLDMFRIDPTSMDILARVKLDAPRFSKQDGHYPVIYREDEQLHVITYITCDKDDREEFTPKCDLVQLSYDLNEILAFGKEQY